MPPKCECGAVLGLKGDSIVCPTCGEVGRVFGITRQIKRKVKRDFNKRCDIFDYSHGDE